MERREMTPLQEFKSKWQDCQNCHLCEGRKKVVLCRGTYPCDLLFVGEAPGVSEDAIGIPFVGPAGHLLDHIIRQGVLPVYSYAITNLVCCIPRGEDGRKVQEPDDEAIKKCSDRLKEFVELCQPRLVVAVGKQSSDYLEPGYRHSIRFSYPIPIVKVIHPAAILRINLAQQGLLIQKTIIAIRNGCEDYLSSNS